MFKSENQALKRLWQAILVPTAKWEQITTDLITDLLESHGFTVFVVFVDKLTKFVIFCSLPERAECSGLCKVVF